MLACGRVSQVFWLILQPRRVDVLVVALLAGPHFTRITVFPRKKVEGRREEKKRKKRKEKKEKRKKRRKRKKEKKKKAKIAMLKRPLSSSGHDDNVLNVKPLGAGNEVGRSCLLLKYKGLTVMLDCGVLPSFSGEASLPFIREIDPASVDVIIITHFHLDHCAALPYFTERMSGFRGRIFATHATIAVMRLILQDFTKRSGIVDAASSNTAGNASGEDREGGVGLYDEADMVACIERMEPVGMHKKVDIGRGAFMTLFNAGHVLGAAMVLLEVGRVKILYTGDFSCEEDRHLKAAEVPKDLRPDVLIAEATCGQSVHEGRPLREDRFTSSVEKIVRRGGKCLIPMQALGRAQEILLILEDLWASKPDLQVVPIYFSSRMADKALEVYKTFIGDMNAGVGKAMADGRNPWRLRFTRSVSGRELLAMEGSGGGGPCVVIAAPGMLQQGTSRELFERWAENSLNGVVLAGYATEGTLARKLEQNPSVVESSNGKRVIARRCTIDRISFIAHSDCLQTQAFVEALKPHAIILVHGEYKGMMELSGMLERKYSGTPGWRHCHTPGNNKITEFAFLETKEARVVGKLAKMALEAAMAGGRGLLVSPPPLLSGVFVQRNFDTLLLAPSDLAKFTQVSLQTLAQKVHVPYRCSYSLLHDFLVSMYGRAGVEEGEERENDAPPGSKGRPPRKTLTVASVTLTHAPPDRCILSWTAAPQSDMVADSLVALIAQIGLSRITLSATSRPCGGGGSGVGHHEHHHRHHHNEGGHEHTRGSEMEGHETPSQSPVLVEGDDIIREQHWAKGILASDSGPCGGGEAGAVLRRLQVLKELLVDQYGKENVSEGTVTAPPLVGSMTKDSESETVGSSSSSSSSSHFHLQVILDGVGKGNIAFVAATTDATTGPAGEFSVSLESGGGGVAEGESASAAAHLAATVSSFLDSLAKSCELADSVCRSSVLGSPSSVTIES